MTAWGTCSINTVVEWRQEWRTNVSPTIVLWTLKEWQKKQACKVKLLSHTLAIYRTLWNFLYFYPNSKFFLFNLSDIFLHFTPILLLQRVCSTVFSLFFHKLYTASGLSTQFRQSISDSMIMELQGPYICSSLKSSIYFICATLPLPDQCFPNMN